MGQEPDIDRLRNAAMRLAAELDEARLYRAAAYVSLAGDAIGEPVGRAAQAGGGARIPELPRVGQVREDGRGEVDLDFTLDERAGCG